jgi:hypothetical protein
MMPSRVTGKALYTVVMCKYAEIGRIWGNAVVVLAFWVTRILVLFLAWNYGVVLE